MEILQYSDLDISRVRECWTHRDAGSPRECETNECNIMALTKSAQMNKTAYNTLLLVVAGLAACFME